MTMIKSYTHFSFNFSSFSRRQTQRVFTSLFLLTSLHVRRARYKRYKREQQQQLLFVFTPRSFNLLLYLVLCSHLRAALLLLLLLLLTRTRMLLALGGGIFPPMCNTINVRETRTIQNSEDKDKDKEEITGTTLFS